MPLTKAINKAKKPGSGTHAHYKEEFGARKLGQAQTPGHKALSKSNSGDVEYRAARAEHFANEAKKAVAAYGVAKTDEERIEHLATAAHAASRAQVHANFVKKTQPGSELADKASLHAHTAKHLHESMTQKIADDREEKKAETQKVNDDDLHRRMSAVSRQSADDQRKIGNHDLADHHEKIAEYHAALARGADVEKSGLRNGADFAMKKLLEASVDHKNDHQRRMSDMEAEIKRTNQADVKALSDHLGGEWHPASRAQLNRDPDAGNILKNGVFVDPKKNPVEKMLGKDGHCHWNTAQLFREGKIDAIVTGYAQNFQGWHQHTWGEKNGKIVETTESNLINTRYFGVMLNKTESVAFTKWAEENLPGKVRTMKRT